MGKITKIAVLCNYNFYERVGGWIISSGSLMLNAMKITYKVDWFSKDNARNMAIIII
jgi:hypothetical protein